MRVSAEWEVACENHSAGAAGNDFCTWKSLKSGISKKKELINWHVCLNGKRLNFYASNMKIWKCESYIILIRLDFLYHMEKNERLQNVFLRNFAWNVYEKVDFEVSTFKFYVNNSIICFCGRQCVWIFLGKRSP